MEHLFPICILNNYIQFGWFTKLIIELHLFNVPKLMHGMFLCAFLFKLIFWNKIESIIDFIRVLISITKLPTSII